MLSTVKGCSSVQEMGQNAIQNCSVHCQGVYPNNSARSPNHAIHSGYWASLCIHCMPTTPRRNKALQLLRSMNMLQQSRNWIDFNHLRTVLRAPMASTFPAATCFHSIFNSMSSHTSTYSIAFCSGTQHSCSERHPCTFHWASHSCFSTSSKQLAFRTLLRQHSGLRPSIVPSGQRQHESLVNQDAKSQKYFHKRIHSSLQHRV